MQLLGKLLLASLLFVPTVTSASGRPSHVHLFPLSAPDRGVALFATKLAGHSAAVAMHWLGRERRVSRVQLGPDHSTLDVHFRDGAELVILPRSASLRRVSPSFMPDVRFHDPSPASPGRALVLEPFADELQVGASEGQAEANTLSQAGFQVTTVRNSAVTVGLMQTLPNYSVVYMLTHSGLLPNGDAVVATGEESPAMPQQSQYAALYSEHSLLQVDVAGQSQLILYNAFTSIFVNNHLGSFPNNSLIFVNGCKVLASPVLWQAFAAKNVSALISWTNDADSNADKQAGTFVFSRMAAGETIAAAIQDAQQNGLAISYVSGQVARLNFVGDGGDTFARALSGSLPTATPPPTATPVPTTTPVPSATPRPQTHRGHCKPGHHRSHGHCVRTKHKRRHCTRHCKPM